VGIATARNLDLFLNRNDDDTDDYVPDPKLLRRDGLPSDTMPRALMARIVQAWNEAYRDTNGFQMPPLELGQRLDALQERSEKRNGLSRFVVPIMFPLTSSAAATVVTLDARRAVLRAYAKAMIAQAQTGKWPSHVDENDPFTGKPLRVKVTEKGLRIYSVGKDRRDDGGLLRRETKGQIKRGEDIVAAYPPIAP
jgi:hypothetical protein